MKDKKVMVGFPASRETQVNWKNYRTTKEHLAWGHVNMGAIHPVLQVPRAGDVFHWNDKHDATFLDGMEITSFGKTMTARECFKDANKDSIIITKGNDILFEEYYNSSSKTKHHVWYSMTKSLTATIFGSIKDKHNIKLDDLASKYVKELQTGDSGYARTTVSHVLNHTTALSLKEEYADPNSAMVKHYLPIGLMYATPGLEYWPDINKKEMLSAYDFLVKYIKEDKNLKPGDKFEYASMNADMLSWIMVRVENKGMEEIVSEVLWQKLGAENDAVFWTDTALMPIATCGFNTTGRDAAKFGKLLLDYGKNWKGEQIIPKEWIESITNEDPEITKAWDAKHYEKELKTLWRGYKNMWWIINAKDGEFAAKGIHGQMIYINRKNNVVISVFSSEFVSSNTANEKTKRSFDLIAKIGQSL